MIKRCLGIVLAGIMLFSLTAQAVSNPSYQGYVYDVWGRSVPAPIGYLCTRVIYPADDQGVELKGPTDLFVYGDRLYIADTKNSRILVLDEDYAFVRQITEVTENGVATPLNQPQGVYLRDDMLFIADTENARVIVCDMDANVLLTLCKPETESIGETTAFRPTAITCDASGSIFVLGAGVYQGLMCYNWQGEFLGFYGSNKVEVTFDVVAKYLWKQLLSQEQAQTMERFVPIEITNLYIDSNEFIFTVTMGSSNGSTTRTGKIQRLNPLGTNILRYNDTDFVQSGGAIYDRSIYGDVEYNYNRGIIIDSILIDIHVDEHGVFSALDRERGRVFQYDLESNLLSVFGGIGNQKGSFVIPSALEKFGGSYIVLDETLGTISVFEPTRYAELLLQATAYYNEGLFTEAKPLWEELLTIYAGNTVAYKSLGKYYMEQQDYETALEYFELGDDRESYSLAYQEVRKQFIQQNFIWILVGLIAAIVLIRFALRLFLRHVGITRKKVDMKFH